MKNAAQEETTVGKITKPPGPHYLPGWDQGRLVTKNNTHGRDERGTGDPVELQPIGFPAAAESDLVGFHPIGSQEDRLAFTFQSTTAEKEK